MPSPQFLVFPRRGEALDFSVPPVLPVENSTFSCILTFMRFLALQDIFLSFNIFPFPFDRSLTPRKVPEEKVPPVLNPLGRPGKHPSLACSLGSDFGR